jgi:hypothetical protein
MSIEDVRRRQKTSEDVIGVTATEAGFSHQQQLVIVLRAIDDAGGEAPMPDLYTALEQHLAGRHLSE